MSQTLKPDIQQIVYNSRAGAFNDTSNPAGQKKKKKKHEYFNIPSCQTDIQRTIDGAHRGRSILLLPPRRVYSPGLGKGSVSVFCRWEALMREGGGGERKREGHCQMQGGRREEDTHTHRMRRTHAVRLCVEAECVKPNNACVIPAKKKKKKKE